MKDKKMAIGTILLLFAISGLCNVINVSAEEVELPPSSYYAYGLDLEWNDKLEIYVDSSGTVNVYIMDYVDYADMVSSGGLTWRYIKRWQDITYLEYTFDFGTLYAQGLYYVVVYNKNVLFGRTVEIEVRRIPYFDIGPIIALIIAIGVISGITVLTVLLVKRSKKKKREAGTQYQEVIKPKSFFCPNCGAENTDMAREYCSNCGSKIKR